MAIVAICYQSARFHKIVESSPFKEEKRREVNENGNF
jgi:hypothetical protein